MAAFAFPFALLAAAPATASEAAISEASAGPGVKDPVAYVRSIYRQYETGSAPTDANFDYSPGLRALIAAAENEQKDEPGRLDFDFWIAGQDWVIKDLKISELPSSEKSRVVVARFKNQSVPVLLHFHFIPQGGKWFLDDVENLAGPAENRWRLRKILTEPPIVSADAGDWENFYQGADGSIGEVRKPTSLHGGILSAEVRARQWEPQDPASQGLFSVEVDCAKKLSRMLRGRLTDGKGNVETRDEPEEWGPIAPNSPSAALHSKYCPAG
jgi:hypothetical protein